MQVRVVPTTSASWKASQPITAVGTWPVKTTMPMESIRASVRPVMVLVAPGPEVTMAVPVCPLAL